MMNPSATGAGRIVRIALAVGLTGLLLWWSDPGQVGRAALRADWRWVAAAIGLVLVDRILMAWRWILLLPEDVVGRIPVWPLLRIFFVSTFVGTFLPSSIGGDAVRAWQLSSSQNVSGAAAVASIVMDRLLGIAALVVMAAAGLALMGSFDQSRLTIAIALTAVAASAVTYVLLSRRFAAMLAGWSGWLPGIVNRRAGSLLQALRDYRARHGVLVTVLVASIAVNVLRVLQAWMLGRGLNIAAPPGAYFAFVPVILLIMLLPISVNGLGTSQAAFIFFFAGVGVPEAQAFALSILYLGLGLVGNVPGGLLVAMGRRTAVAQR